VLGAKHLARIRALVADGPWLTRQELARQVCRMYGWRRPNGALAVRGARQLLIRLDEAGVVCLPAPRRVQGRPRRETRETPALPVAGAAVPSVAEPRPQASRPTLVVRPVCASERHGWHVQMERLHYLGDAAPVGESLRYVAELDGERIALLSWGAAALHNGPRDRYLGWDPAARRLRLELVVNNTRFLMLVRRPHLASRVLAANLRRLGRDWRQAYGHRVVLAETFVDASRFRGTCYRASNWLPVGETLGWSKSGDTYRFNGRPKSVWLYPLERDFKEQLRTGAGARVAREVATMLDLDALPLDGKGGLIEVLRGFADPRKPRGVRHRIETVLATAICAVLTGARSFGAIAEWADDQPPETLRRLGSKRGRAPGERTFRRVPGDIDVQELDRCTGEWMLRQQPLRPGKALALDGKVVRGSGEADKPPVQLLSAIVHGSGTVVAQVAVASKTNEIPMAEPLLDNMDLGGVVVTADALHTQKKLASYLVDQKDADYVFTAKDNQPTLKQDIATLGLDAFPP